MGKQNKQPENDIQANESEVDVNQSENQQDEQTDEIVDELESQDQSDIAVELEEAQAQIAKLQDGYLRAKAEEENVRRRTEKEVANSRKFAVESFAREMLNVHDSLKLACSVEVEKDVDEATQKIYEGVELTLKQLNTAFERNSLTEIAPQQGDKLDPNLHQAMAQIPSEDVESGCVVELMQSGFQLHDRLIRPAMVVVAQ